MSTAPWPQPKSAFATFSQTSIDERIALIDRIITAYERRGADLAQLIAQEVGVPVSIEGAGDRARPGT